MSGADGVEDIAVLFVGGVNAGLTGKYWHPNLYGGVIISAEITGYTRGDNERPTMRSLLAALILFMASTSGGAVETLTLRGGVPEGLPGYAMGADGSLVIELPFKKRILQCVEKALNARVVWEAYPTKRVVQMVIDGKLDLAFPMGFTSERALVQLDGKRVSFPCRGS